MGDYWNGEGHSGGSQFNNMVNNNYDLTSTLTGKHGNSYSRIINGGARLVGVLKISQTTTQTQNIPQDLGFEPNSIIPHLQTRDENLKWQTYYSTVPTPGYNNYLILTHAQSTNLSGAEGKNFIKCRC